jgi:hypothetical protein
MPQCPLMIQSVVCGGLTVYLFRFSKVPPAKAIPTKMMPAKRIRTDRVAGDTKAKMGNDNQYGCRHNRCYEHINRNDKKPDHTAKM